MTGGPLEERVLLYLLEREGGGHRQDDDAATGCVSQIGAYDRSTAGIADGLDMGTAMTDRISLLSSLSSLTARGRLDSRVRTIEGLSGERTVYSLTDAGRERANRIRESLLDERVVVRGDEVRECPLREVPERDGLTLVEALAARAPDGDIYLDAPLESAFVGREPERRRIDGLLETIRDGESEALAITGEAGSGKTALVEHLEERARERGVDVVLGRAHREGNAPYGPLRDAVDTEDLALFDGDGPVATDEGDYETQVARSFAEVESRLRRRASERPLVLIVEDLQWAGAATVDLLGYLVEHLEAVPIGLVVTARSGAASAEALLEAVESTGSRSRLGPLGEEALADLVERQVGRRGVPEEFVGAVSERTGRVPLYVVELVDSLLEDGTIDPVGGAYPDSVEATSLPAVTEAARARLDRLGSDARTVLEAGAVFGDGIEFDVLRIAVDDDEPRIREYVDVLVEGDVWHREGDGAYRFENDVLRTTVYDSIDDERQRALHRRIATALADGEDGDGGRHATITHHYERAGETSEALEHAVAAGERATQVYAHDVAIEYYETALRLARDLGREETILDALEALGDTYYTTGRYEEADKRFQYVRERTEEPERLRRAYRYQATIRFELGEHERTETIAREGLSVGGDAVTREVCRLQDALAGSFFKRGSFKRAIEGHERLLELAESIDDDLMRGRAYQNLGCCYLRRNDAERSIELLERGVELLEEADHERELSGCLNDLALSYDATGRRGDAREALEACQNLAERTGHLRVRLLALNNLSVFAQYDGRWEEAREYTALLRETASRIDNEDSLSFALAGVALTAAENGSIEDARDACRESIDILRRHDRQYHLAHRLIVMARYDRLAGEFETALERVDDGISLARENDFEVLLAAGIREEGRIERALGNVERALERQREALDRILDVGRADQIAGHRVSLAETLAIAGKPEDALEESRAALAALEDVEGHRLVGVKAEVASGTALNRLGEDEAARERLIEALERARSVSTVATCRALRELALCERRIEDELIDEGALETGERIAAEAGLGAYVEQFEKLRTRDDTPTEQNRMAVDERRR